MSFLIDTNILVYRFDSRFPDKQARATELLRRGIIDGTAHLPHQAILEFVAVVTRSLGDGGSCSLLTREDAAYEAEEFMGEFPILFPNEGQLRLAIRGWRTYGLSWFDAHLWSYAEYYGIPELFSEDFQHGRYYGRVKVINPFLLSTER